jgi:hypothetical protein
MRGIDKLKRLPLTALVLCSPAVATAGIESGNSSLIFNAGYMRGSLAAPGETADGNIVNITLEKVGAPGRTAGFFSIGYGKISKDADSSSGLITRSVETIPICIGAKGCFGPGDFQAHLGLAFGTYFSTVVSSGKLSGEDWTSWSTSGFGMGIPVGVTFCLGETLFLNGEYVLNWTWTNESLENDLLHAFVIGLGFRWGKAATGG